MIKSSPDIELECVFYKTNFKQQKKKSSIPRVAKLMKTVVAWLA